MKYEKITRKNYNIHFINTCRFKTVSIDITFSNKFDKEDVPFLSLLIKMLTSSTKKYNTLQALAVQGENLYGAEISSFFNISGDMENVGVSLEFLNPKYTSPEMVEESVKFLNEVLFNPNMINNEFKEEIFNINKNNVINSIKIIKDNPYSYALINFKKEMYKNTSYGYHLFNNIKKIEEVTSKNLYKFYLNILKMFRIDIFVVGDISDEHEFIKLIDKMFKSIDNKFNGELTYELDYSLGNKKIIKETGEFSQSQLFIGYSFKDLTEFEKNYVLTFYNSILGGINNSILFTEVREKNSLCYSVSSSITKNPYSIRVETEIDKSNYKKAIMLIDKAIKMMSDEKKISKLFSSAKENISTALNMFYDNKSSMVEYYYRKEFATEDDIETKRQNYMKITTKDVTNLNKKIVKNITYFLEGVKSTNEENSI